MEKEEMKKKSKREKQTQYSDQKKHIYEDSLT
jgi:hypothetical protein